MSEFKRSPSKVWWASESFEWREISVSPGSQDSGFSDSEIPLQNKKTSPKNLTSTCCEKTTPDKKTIPGIKNSPKVNRSLFSAKDISTTPNQYARSVDVDKSFHSKTFKTASFVPVIDDFLKRKTEILERVNENDEDLLIHNHSLSSDCESELECLFTKDSPKHTSTPKNAVSKMKSWQRSSFHKRKKLVDNGPVQKWLIEIQTIYEQECMTAFQAKSIAGELHQKVAKMAVLSTTRINNIIQHSNCLKQEYKNLNSETKHIAPLVQSLAGNIIDFFQNYSEVTEKMSHSYDVIRKANSNEIRQEISDFFTNWELTFHSILESEVRNLIERLEHPCSELDLRASITGVTSLSLHNESLIEVFTRNDIIPILLILCEKCEGSSIRGLILRALSTMCSTTYSIRQFEKYSGIQTISDTLSDERPEPERSEAVALLAQVTAPWIEDNYTIQNLSDFAKKLVKSLTNFAETTKCCQNLLLCTAALANLSTMEVNSIKYMLHQKTVEVLLKAINRRGPCTSVYLLEQIATLLANMSGLELARQHLVAFDAIPVLLCFLKTEKFGEDVEKRLQQKAIITLSRLCGLKIAAQQLVDLGGVERLVKMCREKNERFSNDAVLVATLATLRKIVEACGKDVINTEDVQELVEPKLLDSFLAYSSQSESYV